MGFVLAAVDDSAAARCVLSAAGRLASLFGVGVEALHVVDESPRTTAAATAAAAGVPFRETTGEAVDCIVVETRAPGCAAAAVGCRSLEAGPAVGHVALSVISAVDKPVLAVPPVPEAHRFERILVPLDGTGATTTALRKVLDDVRRLDGPELVALHVFELDSLPRFGDQLAHEVEAWSEEFLDRYAPVRPEGMRLELRVGMPADVVSSLVEEVGADLVAVGWSQDLAPGRASVVRALLRSSAVPVLLLPTRQPAQMP